jgi:hypothetical protein
VASGVWFWLAFGVVAVLLRGVRWDENYEFAQVILGQVPYPEGHPLYQYVRSFYSLQPFGLAALMHFFPEPLWANGVRNLLFIWASTVPVYLWGYQLSRRPLVGMTATVLVLLGVHVTFYSSYPIHVWPHVFSNGPVGFGYMLLGAWALASHRHRLAGLMLGFAPLVHLGQFPPLLGMAVLYLAWSVYRKEMVAVRRLVGYALPGLIGAVVFALFLRSFAVAPPDAGPYASSTEPMLLWHTFMERYATHRAIPYTTGHFVLVAAVVVGLFMAGLHRLRSQAHADLVPALVRPEAWALLYLALATGTVWMVMAIHAMLGAMVPYLLVGWLPYRLMNHIAPLLLPLMLAVLFSREHRTPWWLPLLIALPLLAPLVHLIDSEFANRYVMSGDYVVFVLVGATLGSLSVAYYAEARKAGWIAGGAALTLFVLLGLFFHQFGAACGVIGFALAWVPTWRPLRPAICRSATAGLVGVLLVVTLAKEHEARQHLPVPRDMVDVRDYLTAVGAADAMLLVPNQQMGMQMHTGHPVMADMATMFHGIYRPPIAPAVDAIYSDFYGMYLNPEAAAPDRDRAWHEVWPAKPLTEWQRLGAKYGIGYVVAPSFMKLPLEPVLPGRRYSLYRIPVGAAETTASP